MKHLPIDSVLQLPSDLSLNERITARADIYGYGWEDTFDKGASKNQIGEYSTRCRREGAGNETNIPIHQLGADGLAMVYDIY